MISRKNFIAIIVTFLTIGHAWPAFAAVSAQEAGKLGTTLTAIGAEKAGNAGNSIPAYTGGLTQSPAGFVKGSGIRPDPFADEKPLFSINAKNMSQYSNRLTEGVKEMMQKYPAFRIDVYKTHRTAAFPGFVLENTKKNALTATTAQGGLSLRNAHGGYPFPIPADGHQAMWNHQTRFLAPEACASHAEAYTVSSSGSVSLGTKAIFTVDFPYYDTSKKSSDLLLRYHVKYEGPSRRAGEYLLILDPLDYTANGRRSWTYLPGQRRVRLAPDVSHDTPNATNAGGNTYDDAYVFSGSMERFDWKLIGKKEVYVPYNTYRATYYQGDVKKMLTQFHINPDYIRWELHRVWVVEATLKPGMRHVYSKRVFYLDEDTWTALAADQYDKRGNMYRVSLAFMTQSYDVPAPSPDFQAFFDLISRSYIVSVWPRYGVNYFPKPNDRFYTPDALASGGLR